MPLPMPLPAVEPEAVTAPVAAPAPTPGPDAAPASGRRRVVLVDTEDDSRRLLASGLEDLGVEVVELKRGQEVLPSLEKHTPALVVLDPDLPDLHGFEVLRRMGEVDRLASVPVVLLSGRYNGWRFAADLKDTFGVRAFLPKPFGIVEAAACIEGVLESRGDERPSELPITPDADRALKAGTEAYQRGDFEAAVQHLEKGVLAAPDSYRMHYQLALLLGRRGELFRAISELECSVGLFAGFFPALKNLALLYEKAGFRKKALEAWERAVPAAPDEATRGQIKERVLSLL
jgi:DNA-binding response OmpR family regulator